MPELPDVAGFKQYFDATSLHQSVERTIVRDERLLADLTAEKLARAVKGAMFKRTDRRGKFLFVAISRGGWLLLHFGMSGELDYRETEGEPPKYARVTFEFTNGHQLHILSQRMLGRVGFTEDVEQFIADQELGPDALDEALTEHAFIERLSSRRGMVKPALMDQSLIAGIGNIYGDEILFHARLHPETAIDELASKDLKRLYEAMREVLRVASDHGGRIDQLPAGFLLPVRGEGEKCPRCGGEIEKVQVSGRSAYYCPKCQPKRQS